MSRRRHQLRNEARTRWPRLQAFLSSTIHGDDRRSVDDDVAKAMRALPLSERQTLVREWWAWNSREGRMDDIRSAVEALDPDILFGDADHARHFMNDVYDRLVVSVRNEVGRDWKP